MNNHRKAARKVHSNHAIGYLRVSTDRQDESMELQERRVNAYCIAMGLDLKAVLVEPDVSGKSKMSERPEGSKIEELIRAGASHVVALKLDRVFRNASDALVTAEEWQKHGVSLHLVDLGGTSVNTGSTTGKLFFTMLAGFAEFERNTIADRIRAALQNKKSTGKVYSGTPYGMEVFGAVKDADGKITSAGKLRKNAAEQEILSRIRNWRKAGKSYSGIANELNALGITAKRGGEWHSQSVKKVLETSASLHPTTNSRLRSGAARD